jgi:uncharacterized protein (TIGR03437 family)
MRFADWKAFSAAILSVAAYRTLCLAQTQTPVILTIDVENVVQYVDDSTDFTKLATVPTATTGGAPLNFRKFVILGDIVAVNGTPVKGTLVESARAITMRPSPTPGQAIADINRNNQNEVGFEILSLDGNAIGTFIGSGLGNGPPPPGAPQLITQGNNSINGGTGAFLGMRGGFGQNVTNAQASALRVASMTEDPANRRLSGGATQRFILYVIPLTRPEVLVSSGAPSIFHADFTPVTAVKPANRGEVLILLASGLGATRPGVDPGQPFPPDKPQLANAPVHVLVNGTATNALYAGGYPGAIDAYQVNFRVPDTITAGQATIQVTAAWIPGTAVKIPIQ